MSDNPFEDLENRFSYHPASTQARQDDHSTVRMWCLDLAYMLEDKIPSGREKSLALTKLEEVMFWANAAIARQVGDD